MLTPEHLLGLFGQHTPTIDAYDTGIDDYEANTVVDPSEQHPAKKWIRYALDTLDQRSEIKHLPVLEIGSGTGRDADYLESQGVSVCRTDATPSFLQALHNKGHTAYMLNALTDEFGGPYRMIFANGVFPHFSNTEVRLVINKAYDSLAPNGLLVFSLKITDEKRHWEQGTIKGWDVAIPPNQQEVPPKLNEKRYYYIRHPLDARTLALHGDSGRNAIFMPYNTERSQWLGAIVCKDGFGELTDNSPRYYMPFPPLPDTT